MNSAKQRTVWFLKNEFSNADAVVLKSPDLKFCGNEVKLQVPLVDFKRHPIAHQMAAYFRNLKYFELVGVGKFLEK